jgi:hypothetical protein
MVTRNAQGLVIPDDPNTASAASASGNPNGAQTPGGSPFSQGGTVTPIGGVGAAATPLQQFAFNPQYEAQNRAIQQRVSDAGADKQGRINSLEAGYQTSVTDANQSKQRAMQSIIERMGSNGMLNSSANAESQGNLENDFTKYMGTLTTSRGNQLADYENAFNRVGRDAYTEQAGLIGSQRKDETDRANAAALAQQQADNAQRQAEAQAAQTAALIAAQQQAINVQPSGGGGGIAYSNAGGGGGGLDIGTVEGFTPNSSESDFLGQIGNMNMTQLLQLGRAPQLTDPLRNAMTQRIQQLNAAGTTQQKATGNYARALPGQSAR